MLKAAAALVAFCWIPLLQAQHQDHTHAHESHPPRSSNEAPIKVTINPEARVSVALDGKLPPTVTRGKALSLPVTIVNQGFVTALLQARLVESAVDGVALEFSSEPLKGLSEEHRILRITLTKAGPVDITVAFRAKNLIPDLGGRDRIHFVLNCLPDK